MVARARQAASLRMVVVTMDTHLATATASAAAQIARALPGVTLEMHAASEYAASPEALARCRDAIAAADILVVTMLFLEDHYTPILDLLQKRRTEVDAMVCAMSAGEVVRLTRIGRFDMSKPGSSIVNLLKRLKGSAKADSPSSNGERQMRMLRRLPKILRFIPGTAQDVRAYFLCLQYWLGGSQENMVALTAYLVNHFASGPREGLRGRFKGEEPVEYPETGVYHPDMRGRIAADASLLPQPKRPQGRVGVLLLRSYLLAGNAAHYDGVIRALEARGLAVVPVFATGLDSRPAIEAFFFKDGVVQVDAVVSLTGFSLVGGPAYNDSQAAEAMLARLDLPYIAAHPVEFQTLAEWGGSERGLLPVESTIMVAIPELDGATSPMVYGGRPGAPGVACTGCDRGCRFEQAETAQDMVSCPERAERLADRLAALVSLRRKTVAQRRVAIVVFNFPPNGGSVGTAANLSVLESVHNTLVAMRAQGYRVSNLPERAEDLREALTGGNAQTFGTEANVLAQIAVQDHIARETWLSEIERAWGPAPGRQLTDGRQLFIQGLDLGEVVLMVQPAFGYEGDPMRLLFEQGLSPTHAFSAFYRWLREDFRADAVLHYGTHGSLEFMPGKQAGTSGACWPDRLIGAMPNFYLYASNNPSEGTIAKRRSAATLISYLTPPLAQAGLHAGLQVLSQSIDRWRGLPPLRSGEVLDAGSERASLISVMAEHARAVDMQEEAGVLIAAASLVDGADPALAAIDCKLLDKAVYHLHQKLEECERSLIPVGLHVVGRPMGPVPRKELLLAMAQAHVPLTDVPDLEAMVEAIVERTGEQGLARAREIRRAATGGRANDAGNAIDELLVMLERVNREIQVDGEIQGILRGLNGQFIRPAAGGDILHAPEILPTGRNLHGFDPFRMPSRFAVIDGTRQAERLLERHVAQGHPLPESIAMVLWGTDNLKTEGGPIAQVMALMGARPRFDSFGRLAGAELVGLEELGRPRIDVVITLSGIFRDLLPLQIKMLAEAAWLASQADEPPERNFIRKHSLAYQAEHGCDLETASLRVFGNASGAYGANVNIMVDQSTWQDEDELADSYSRRKGFAYGRAGKPVQSPALLQSALKDVGLAYQNLDSIEIGVTTVDNYFDTLGGVTRAVRQAKVAANKRAAASGAASAESRPVETPVYIGDQTSGAGVVRTLSEQVALEARTRMLNPKWYEGVLDHGYEGVRQIEAHLTNTMGWSATTGQVHPWVYAQLTQTFVLDDAMRERLARLNPKASAKLANRLIEASERNYWTPDNQTLEALRRAGEELEDRIEGVYQGATA